MKPTEDLKTQEVDFSFTEPKFSFNVFNKVLSDKNILVLGEMIQNIRNTKHKQMFAYLIWT